MLYRWQYDRVFTCTGDTTVGVTDFVCSKADAEALCRKWTNACWYYGKLKAVPVGNWMRWPRTPADAARHYGEWLHGRKNGLLPPELVQEWQTKLRAKVCEERMVMV